MISKISDVTALRKFWGKRLENFAANCGVPAALSPVSDAADSRTPITGATTLSLKLPKETLKSLQDLCQGSDLLLHTAVTAAAKICLRVYTGNDQTTIGVPPAGQDEPANILPISSGILETDSFQTVLKETRNLLQAAYVHQGFPYHAMVEDSARSDLKGTAEDFGLLISTKGLHKPFPGHSSPLVLEVHHEGAGIDLKMTFENSRYQPPAILAFFDHLCSALDNGLYGLDGPVSNIKILTGAEVRTQKEIWNKKARPYQGFPNAAAAFEAQAAAAPDSPCIISDSGTLTYAKVNSLANRLARFIRKKGAGADALVGLCLDRSPEMVISILGIIKAGAAYVPLDPELPADRLQFMFEDSGKPLVLTQAHFLPMLASIGCSAIALDGETDKIANEKEGDLGISISPAGLAYMIFTSGSTGRPKGAMNSHEALMNRLYWMQKTFGLNEADRVLQKTPYAFDVSVWEFLWPCISGSALVMLRPKGHLDTACLAETIRTHKVTTLHFVPSMLRIFLDEPAAGSLPSVRHVICSGEALSKDLCSRFHQVFKTAELHNLYGPTEAAIDVSSYQCLPADKRPCVPIGWPIANIRLYIVDRDFNLAPIGSGGEICIGGVGLARGYHLRPDLTAEKFSPDPFSGLPGARLYKTGDLARYQPDGAIEYLGRIDHQIKIRGFRVELGEIELALLKQPSVKDAVVIMREDTPGLKQLAAYIVPSDSQGEELSSSFSENLLEGWQNLFDYQYDHDFDVAATSDFTTWTNSYTGEPIPEIEMQKWVDETTSRILAAGPKNILEIGCGTGLLLYKIAPLINSYHGIDASIIGINRIGEHLAKTSFKDRVTLEKRMAHEISGLPGMRYDTIVINSVAQYFPTVEYLLEVIEKSLALLTPGGHVFIGDVRNFDLASVFYLYSRARRAAPGTPVSQIKALAEIDAVNETELFVSPAFFESLSVRFPEIGSIDISVKSSSHLNELTQFRYDVLLTKGPATAEPSPEVLPDFSGNDSLEPVARALRSRNPRNVLVQGIPNTRLRVPLECSRLSDLLPPSTTACKLLAEADLRPALKHFDPAELWQLGESLGYKVEVNWGGAGHAGSVNALFKKSGNYSAARPAVPDKIEFQKRMKYWASAPLRIDKGQLSALLKTQLAKTLPDYMVPAVFVFLGSIPLSPNGKIDRRQLPPPKFESAPGQAPGFVNPLEEKIAGVWSNLLNRDPFRADADLFELGVDSIVSMQAVSRLIKLDIHLTFKELMENPTIAAQAKIASAKLEKLVSAPGFRPSEGPLSPLQHWFFSHEQVERDHWNLSLTLAVQNAVDPDKLSEAIQYVFQHHDALKLRFDRPGSLWTQHVSHAGTEQLCVQRIDHSKITPDKAAEQRKLARARLAKSLDIEQGPVSGAILFEGGRQGSSFLFLTVHHLVADAVSLRIIAEDIQTVYEQLTTGKQVFLPAPGANFLSWTTNLAKIYSKPERSEIEYWSRITAGRGGSRSQRASSPNSEILSATETISVGPEETAALQKMAELHRASMGDVVLAVFALELSRRLGIDLVYLDVEGHGRDPVGSADDFSRTVGWFSSLYPVALDARGAPDLEVMLQRVVSALRTVPHSGIGFRAILAYWQDGAQSGLETAPNPSICFNYLGNFDAGNNKAIFSLVRGEMDPLTDPNAIRSHDLDVSGEVREGILSTSIKYGTVLHEKKDITELLEQMRGSLSGIRKINAGADRQEWPLTSVQEGMMFESNLAPNSGIYIMQMACRFEGNFDRAAFIRAWAKIMDAHAVLRSAFITNETGHTRAIVREGVRMPVSGLDWSGVDKTLHARQLEEFLKTDRLTDFDLSKAPLMRGALIKLDDRSHYFIWTHHHLILDGWSVGIVLKDLFSAYVSEQGHSVSTPIPSRSFSTYLNWLAERRTDSSRAFWQSALAGLVNPAKFGIELEKKTVTNGLASGHGKVSLKLDPAECAALNTLAKNARVTLNTVFQGAWGLLLSQYCGRNDVCFGTIVSTRPAELLTGDPVAGPFINTLPLRLNIDKGLDCHQWLQTVQSSIVGMLPHSHCSLIDIQNWSGTARGTGLFESIIAFENYPVSDLINGNSGGFSVCGVEWRESTEFPLSVVIIPGAAISVDLQYRCDSYPAWVIDRLLSNYKRILKTLCAFPKRPLAGLEINDEKESEWQLRTFNDTRSSFPSESTIISLFQDKAALAPGATALAAGGVRLTFSELNAKANRLAHYLRSLGSGPGQIVGICQARGIDSILSILAVLKTGAAYAPIDPALPEERIKTILEDTGIKTVLALGDVISILPEANKIIDIGRETHFWAGLSPDNLPETGHPLSLAYVLFTSGSTGKPKAVMIHHRGLVNYASWCIAAYHYDKGQGAPLISSLSYDLPVTAVFGALISGQTLHIHPEPDTLDSLIAGLRTGADYSVVKLTPAHLEVLSRSLEASDPSRGARVFVIGGEQLLAETLDWFKRAMPDTLLVNEYGPTETVVGCSTHTVGAASPSSGAIPIGRPIANTQLYILNDEMRTIPRGATGELYIGGEGVCRGYFGHPGLTAEKFVPDPFTTAPGKRLYRTGDLARFTEQGELEFTGRNDFQVKVRGFRVELGDIEAVLIKQEGVRAAIALAHAGHDGHTKITAYLVSDKESGLDKDILRERLKQCLPPHMIPAALVILEAFPLTANGKVDRHVLEKLPAANDRAEPDTTFTPTEQKLAVFWQEILGCGQIGKHDDFFAAGGHSLMASRVRARIKSEFGLEMPLKVVFEQRTISELALAVDKLVQEAEGALLDRLEQLSDEEARELLSKEDL
ncbi:MAG: amino acid adenylation domain-containing protein [Elusimicrobiota bacterium]|nr:amino acid adenylation domain-containing protein [Elusimicrobiota bacterium]